MNKRIKSEGWELYGDVEESACDDIVDVDFTEVKQEVYHEY